MTRTTTTDLKATARDAIEQRRDELVDLSHRIHAAPELGFEEHRAAGWACELLESQGFAVERGAGGLATAFVASIGRGALVVTFCAEYDALPGIGHACGHNMICASSIGAALGLAPVVDDLGITVKVLGTPAEENGGGKVTLLDAGCFDDAHVALMMHPAPQGADIVDAGPTILARTHLEVEYRGRAAHAAGGRAHGVNALDAAVIAQTAIALLRQQLPAGDLVHGIVTHGGDAVNVIPERTVLEYQLRSVTKERNAALEARVRRCFEAGALATGCEMTIREPSPAYSHLEADVELTETYGRNARVLGRDPIRIPDDTKVHSGGSTDMGNVSLRLPVIHPMVAISGATASPHNADFTTCTATAAADEAVMFAATALAWTALDAAVDDTMRARLLDRERRVTHS